MPTKETLYRKDRVRGGDYAQHMNEAAKAGKCVFCDIDFTKNKPLDKNGNVDLSGSAWKYWWIWWNPYPQNHQQHLMFVLKRHVGGKTPEKIFLQEWFELVQAFLWAIAFYKFWGGGFDFRFGDTEYNAGTIPGHFHAQIQAPWGTGQVLALFYADLSPLEQARTANRVVYRDDNQKIVTGYVVHSQSYILNKNFHWEKFNGDYSHAYVHCPEAIEHIAGIFSGDELRPEGMIPAKYTKGGTTEALSTLWEVFTFREALGVANDFDDVAYGRDRVLGYAFQNAKGLYLSRSFEWDSPTYVVHAEQAYDYILAVLYGEIATIYNADIATDGSKAEIDDGTPLRSHLKRYFYR